MARPLDMKVSFTDETVDKIAELKAIVESGEETKRLLEELQDALQSYHVLREDLELMMRVLAHRHCYDEWRRMEWGPMPELPDVGVAREVLRQVEALLVEDNRGSELPKAIFCIDAHDWEVRDGFNMCKNCPAVRGRAE